MKKIGTILLSLMIGGICGFGFGMLMDTFAISFTAINFIIFALSLVLGYILAILVHECGHLIAGLLSHYELISFRLFSWVFQREEGKLRVMRNPIPGTLGQCLMAPKSTDATQPYFLYHYGGSLMNVVCVLLSLALLMVTKRPVLLCIFTLIFLFWNAYFALCNGIPLTLSGIPNDARNVQFLRKEEADRICLLKSMRMLSYLQKGCLYAQIPMELYEMPPQASLDHPFVFALKLTSVNRLAEQQEEQDIQELLALLRPYVETLPGHYRLQFRCVELMQELLHENRKDIVEELYDSAMKNFLKKTQKKASTQLIYAVLAGFYEHELATANQCLDRCEELIPSTPFYADQQMLYNSIEEVKKRLL